MTLTLRFLLVVSLLGSCAACAQERRSPDTLVGLWGAEETFGPLVRGELTIDARNSEWRARIAGFDVPVQRMADAVNFTLPGDTGEFKGRLAKDSKSIIGAWIQPAGLVYSMPYTSPVELVPISPGVWRGRVTPLDARMSFYVSIQKAQDGLLSAFIRNPEFNYLARRVYTVELNHSAVTLNAKNGAIRGTYDSQTDQLWLPLLNGAPALALTRRKDDASGFFPRTPKQAAYTYRQPIAGDDGWRTGSLAEVGLDPRPIAALIEKIQAADPAANPLNIQSLLIARHGKLVVEEYFYGFDKERPHDMRSAGKTFAPVMVGIAREHGAKVGPDTPVYALFPEYKPFANWDERKSKMQVKDLMSMTAGYDCDEDNAPNAPGNEETMQGQNAQPDWYKWTLDLPMSQQPGGNQAHYCSAELNLVGGVAKKVTGASLVGLFDEYFARPLQFHTYHLNLAPTGDAYMGGGAYIRPRDQLKLGQLYLSGGTWNGRRVVSKDWVEQSLASHAVFPDRFGVDHEYGWGWHIHHLHVGGRTYREYESGGNGGQLVLLLPELDMVVGFTGGSYGDFRNWGRWGIEVVPQYIVAAASAGNLAH